MRRAISMREMARNKNNKEFANFMSDDNPNYLGYGAAGAGVAGAGVGAELYRRRALRNNPNFNDPTGLTSRNQSQVGRVRSQIGQDFNNARQGVRNQFGNARQGISNRFGQARDAVRSPGQTAQNAGQSVKNQFGNARQGVTQDFRGIGDNYKGGLSENMARGTRVRSGLQAGRKFLGTNTGKVGLLGTALLGGGLAYNKFRD